MHSKVRAETTQKPVKPQLNSRRLNSRSMDAAAAAIGAFGRPGAKDETRRSLRRTTPKAAVASRAKRTDPVGACCRAIAFLLISLSSIALLLVSASMKACFDWSVCPNQMVPGLKAQCLVPHKYNNLVKHACWIEKHGLTINGFIVCC
jgi:hypothetical protein